jgi:hypothetical protein
MSEISLQAQVDMLERRSDVADRKIASFQAAAAASAFAAAQAGCNTTSNGSDEDGEDDNLIWNINAMCIIAWKAGREPSAPAHANSQNSQHAATASGGTSSRTCGGGLLRGIRAHPTRLLPLWTLRLLPILIVFFEVLTPLARAELHTVFSSSGIMLTAIKPPLSMSHALAILPRGLMPRPYRSKPRISARKLHGTAPHSSTNRSPKERSDRLKISGRGAIRWSEFENQGAAQGTKDSGSRDKSA